MYATFEVNIITPDLIISNTVDNLNIYSKYSVVHEALRALTKAQAKTVLFLGCFFKYSIYFSKLCYIVIVKRNTKIYKN